jgi:hypothetical protein
MSGLADCCSVCGSQIAPIAIPGPQGPTGAAGTNGTNGVSAFTTTTAIIGPTPGDTTTAYTISVASSVQFVVGQDIIAGQGPGAALASPGPLAMVITAIPSPNSITVKNLRVADQGVTVSSGAVVSVAGFLPTVPMAIAQGGTASTTKTAAQTALGLGQNSLISSAATGLAQVILAAGPVQVGAIDITLPETAGVYELRAQVSVDFAGTTFAATRHISAKIRNITQGTLLSTGVINCPAVGPLSYPTHQIHVPPVRYAAGNINDHLQLSIEIDVVNTAGTLSVDAGSLEAIPIRLP